MATLFLLQAVPSAAQFSHRIHLAEDIACMVCHAAALTSTKAADSLLPDAKVCMDCHTGETAKGPKLDAAPEIKPPYDGWVKKFNHQFHSKMGNIATLIARAIDNRTYLSDPGDTRKLLQPAIDTKDPCRACHRGLESSDAVTAAAFPRMADCLVCHSRIDPPFTCTKCHTEDQPLKPADHTPDFVDVHSAGKIADKTGCAVCHGRTFTCLGCH